MQNNEILKKVTDEISSLEYVDTLALSGSRTGLINDEKSDFDIYVYSNQEVDINFRKKLAQKYAQKAEVDNRFFGPGDEWILKDSAIHMDFMYRCLDWANEEINRVWMNHQASIGYSTCFLYNIATSKIIYDKNHKFEQLQKMLNTPYPEELVQNILDKNYPLLKSKITASFYEQIKNAVERNDLFSVNHRLSALLVSYFDILFAINKVLHPGEKRLVPYVLKTCKTIPANFEKNMQEVLCSSKDLTLLTHLDVLLDELDKTIKKAGFTTSNLA